jgi:uncharacterized membrane protein affecting hemolysin expression
MQAITAEIVAVDPKFELVISESTLCDLNSKRSKNNHVAALSKSIISQQLAVKANSERLDYLGLKQKQLLAYINHIIQDPLICITSIKFRMTHFLPNN